MKLTVARKMLLGFGSILIILLTMMGISYSEINSIKNTYEDLLNNNVQKVNLTHELIESSKEMQLANRGYLLMGNEASLADYQKSKSQYKKLSKKIMTLLTQKSEEKILQELEQYSNQYIAVAEKTISLKQDHNPDYLNVISIDGPPLVLGVQKKANEMIKIQTNDIAQVRIDTLRKVKTLQFNLLLFSILALLVGGVIAFFIGRNISNPVKRIATAAEKIASGDLSQEEIRVKTKDEIGDLAHSFNDMAGNLREVLTQINKSAEQVAAASQELYATTEQTTQASDHISSAIQEVASGAEVQVTNSKESANAMEEVAVGTQKIAESASTVRDSAQEASVLSERGNDSINRAIHQMNTIENETEKMMSEIGLLKERSLEIGKIIEVITGISDQTNLLALNAAIEAARAGEHGKGFAVVADEVRKLAEQSRLSAGQIVELINQIQKDTENVNQNMVENSKEVALGKSFISETGEIFGQITKAVSKVNGEIQEVSAASEQISANTQQVAASVEQLSTIAKETSEKSQDVSASSQEQLASIEEITASSESLSTLAQDLQGIVAKFTI
ncbi:MAG: methyl-accepting chemotaxis protein [Bacillota bacterium]|nr:methyl-accepting chemotaxis protein [Bacillota bacterium]